MTLRQPRKYKRINSPCQLDSIQKINPPGWPIPCSSARSARLQPSARARPAAQHFSRSFRQLPPHNPPNHAVSKWERLAIPGTNMSIWQIIRYLHATTALAAKPRLFLLAATPALLTRQMAPQPVSSLPTPPSRTALPHRPTHLHCLRLSNFHTE